MRQKKYTLLYDTYTHNLEKWEGSPSKARSSAATPAAIYPSGLFNPACRDIGVVNLGMDHGSTACATVRVVSSQRKSFIVWLVLTSPLSTIVCKSVRCFMCCASPLLSHMYTILLFLLFPSPFFSDYSLLRYSHFRSSVIIFLIGPSLIGFSLDKSID